MSDDFEDLLPPATAGAHPGERIARLEILVKILVREMRAAHQEARDYRHDQAGRHMEMDRRLGTVEQAVCDPGKPRLNDRIGKIEDAIIPVGKKTLPDRVESIEDILGNANVSWKTVTWLGGSVAAIASMVTWVFNSFNALPKPPLTH